MARRPTSRRIKAHRQYTYEKAAAALGVTPQTLRKWRGEGLPVLTSKIPHLIVGSELKAFLDKRNAKAKTKLHPEQFRCMRCRTAVAAYGGFADYTALTPDRGVLSTLCAACEGKCTKFVNKAQLDHLKTILSVENRDARCA